MRDTRKSYTCSIDICYGQFWMKTAKVVGKELKHICKIESIPEFLELATLNSCIWRQLLNSQLRNCSHTSRHLPRKSARCGWRAMIRNPRRSRNCWENKWRIHRVTVATQPEGNQMEAYQYGVMPPSRKWEPYSTFMLVSLNKLSGITMSTAKM